ncbi:hypothetical protein HY57_04765 [Dyella japonica A8]|uniref:Uncharacterized protein n=1 Tax=Dyella japonica A8 TaxID=1217721 RepID=A0A075JXN2_9GAMM|nr:hypothetical protein HY57_04765 [Dyella japonica A8]
MASKAYGGRFPSTVSSLSVQYIVCPHCAIELRKGIKACRGCDAAVRYGPPWPYIVAALVPSVWLAVVSHRIFYDSVIVSVLVGAIFFGGLWAMLSMAFDDRAVFKRPST